jgi:4-carboxymuconolactone decarboxylase
LVLQIVTHDRKRIFLKTASGKGELPMAIKKIPSKHYQELTKRFPGVMTAIENLGSAIREEGPIDEKTTELIQLAAAAALQSEGSVHSHTRRALQTGATKDEIYHALLLLVSTIGFPRVSAAISWSQDVLNKKKNK